MKTNNKGKCQIFLIIICNQFRVYIYSQNKNMSNTLKNNSPADKFNSINVSMGSIAEDLVQLNSERMNKMYSFPAKKSDAQIHQLATRFGYNSLINDKGQKSSICPCCQLPINTLSLSLLYPTTPNVLNQNFDAEEYKMSSSTSLFFTFIKMIILYLLLRFILTDSFNMLSSIIAGDECHSGRQECYDSALTLFSAYNKLEQISLMNVVDILNLITICLSIAYFVTYRKIQYKIESLINGSQHTQDDYTLFCSRIPILLFAEGMNRKNIVFDYKQSLKKVFQTKLEKWLTQLKGIQNSTQLEKIEKEFVEVTKNKNPLKEFKVKSITLCFDLTQVEKLIEMKESLMKVHEAAQKQKQKESGTSLVEEIRDPQSLRLIPNQIKILNEQQIKMSKKFAQDSSMSFNLTHFVGKAFVSFEYQHYRDYFLREYERNNGFLGLQNGEFIKVAPSVSPSDVNWYNMKIETATRTKYIFQSYGILIMVLTFAFAGVLGIFVLKVNWHKPTAKGDQSQTLSLLLTIFASITTLVINTLLGIAVKSLTDYQKHQTKSKYLISLVVKTLVTQFFNTALIYFFVSIIIPSPYLSEQGLVVQVDSLFLTSAIIQILMNLANPGLLVKNITNWFKYRKVSQVKKFQVDLNAQLQKPEFDIAERYSYYLLQIYTSAFYSYLAPVIILLLIFTLAVQYWIDKLNLFTRSSLKYEFDFFVSKSILKLFECSLIIFAVGNFIFSKAVRGDNIHYDGDKINYVNVVSLIIASLYTFLILFAPSHWEKKLFGSYEEIEKKTYSTCLNDQKFKETYSTSNPGTRFVKEIDINTKKEVNFKIDDMKFADATELAEAKKNANELIVMVQQPFNPDSEQNRSVIKSVISGKSRKSGIRKSHNDI